MLCLNAVSEVLSRKRLMYIFQNRFDFYAIDLVLLVLMQYLNGAFIPS